MAPQVLVVYTNTLFAEGLAHLLAGRAECTISGIMPIDVLTADRLAETPATVIILEGDGSAQPILAAMRLLLAQSAAFTLIRVDLGVPPLHVYRADHPVPAGLDELAGVIRGIDDRPADPKRRPLEARP